MEIQRVEDCTAADGTALPAYLILPEGDPRGASVVAHGYASSKEAFLGLGVKVAEAGWAALVIDLRGHGEHPSPLSEAVLGDINGAVAYARQRWPGLPVAAIGHSLSGRLALMSDADLLVAISPAVPSKPSVEGREVLTKLSATKVNQPSADAVLQLLQALGPVPDRQVPTLVFHGEGDIPSLIEGIQTVFESLSKAELEPVALHQLPSVTLEGDMAAYLPKWLNHVELPVNAEVFSKLTQWLSGQAGAG
jgi:pimeloyl-ACP methyl ester carboxylesterase